MELTGTQDLRAEHPPTYLIVDDAAPVRTVLQRHLQELGVPSWRIHVAEDGEEALRMYEEHEPTVVLLDLLLPGIDGEAVATEIFDTDPDAKIVVVTGRQREDDQSSRMLQMGAFDFLPKPIRRKDVEHVLWELASEEGQVDRIA